ncbi:MULTISPECIES: FtsW/RodA/SpoVE family cell cycle protein [unclassified Staphylococcus]|uniref:cell division peptidoglycan polymerase FtsW n=1 Tax=unclassified Staphylococcus TaxID=91994 RepID=UPI0021D225AA|nr:MULTISPECIES: FtsW/RodA/SpoVE family cell cycle protein [unclassified Staphylococcus]UXR70218.1 FtsW/RodA/SpoVE family cell cycle protein [Staphylococcus sp. IVB6246]UXR72279.1 FtsW/RodA/SpoVE family cell cycle protein [Staphylococcus sp. IVB6240]UXR74587.1 FtsW/RodA/SpoVE family cell cycle protein [Staphylococcus sp. IVB6238]UXR76972.1 FtsW/RodA/SpoVE family cell cycle protein [Staphylococcus sp. IVB6233]UXR81098.1 FtsW/RodA/SpoVE family cell cycle protein [Staphylococcus sp. IVB6218]
MNRINQFFRYILRSSKYIDFPLLLTYLALCLIGLTMVYSASMVPATRGTLTGGVPVSGTYFYMRQLVYVIVGFTIVFFMAYIMDVRIIKNRNVQLGMMGVLLLLLFATLVLGSEINGSKSWLNLGFMNLQASELLKIGIILYVPYIIDRKKIQIQRTPRVITGPIIFVGFIISLVLLQKDIGQTLLIGAIFFCIIVYSGIGIKNLLKIMMYAVLGLITVLVIIIIFRINVLPAYLTARFSALENPFNYESGIGYHLANSLLAIGNGGFFGRGLGNSVMKLGYLPEPHTDFIFAVICEELGFIGALIILILIYSIVYRALTMAAKTNSYFYKLVCVGIASYIGIQAFVNLGGISGLIPLTGVPLPFISFGGSSMMSLSLAMGLLLLIGKQIKYEEARQRYYEKQQR